MGTVRLQVREWQNHCFVSRSHPAPERVRAEVDRLAERLPEDLAAALARAPDGGDNDSVVLVRRLDFDCALDVAADPDVLANHRVIRFVRALATTIDAGNGVVRFPSVAAWRARFLADVATGGPRQAWYYRAFDGLRSLPDAALVRTVLLEDAALGCATLAALPASAWPALSDLLSRGEALRILAGLAWQIDGDGPTSSSLQRFADAAAGWLPHAANGPVRALAIFAEGLRVASVATRALGAGCLVAGERAASSRNDGDRSLDDALLRTRAAAGSSAERDLVDAARRLLAAHPECREQSADAGSAGVDTGRESSDFAALALLLPEFESLLDPYLCAALPACPHAHPRKLIAWLSLAHCAGRERAPRFVDDGFWRDFFDLAPQLGLPELLAWLSSTSAAQTLTRLAERTAGLARGALLDVPLRAGRKRGWQRIDEETGIWCAWTDAPAAHRCPRPITFSTIRRAHRDWRYLAFDRGLPPDWEQVCVWLAQVAMRRFAWRLPGCGRSSLPWLHANLLAGSGRRIENARLCLSRPPLHALLGATGIARATIAWSGPPARRLSPEYPR